MLFNFWKKKNTYTLMSKDKPVLTFTYRMPTGAELFLDAVPDVKVVDIERNNLHLVPKGLGMNYFTHTFDIRLGEWLFFRQAHNSRTNIKKLLRLLKGEDDMLSLTLRSKGLSLNDTYWIKAENDNSKWADINLYNNPFEELPSEVVFALPDESFAEMNAKEYRTPEFTTAGCVRKRWINKADNIYLRKGLDNNWKCQPDGRSIISMEYFATQTAAALGFENVPYSLEKCENSKTEEIVCDCPLFTSEDVGYVSIHYYLLDKDYKKYCLDGDGNLRLVDFHKHMAALFGKKAYEDIMLFDAIFLNVDRHLGNYGMLIDNNTGEYIKPAPIFDSGSSLFALAFDKLNAEDIKYYCATPYVMLQGKFMHLNEQMEGFVQERHIPILEKMSEFQFTDPANVNFSQEMLDVLSLGIRCRCKLAIEMFNNKMAKKQAEVLARKKYGPTPELKHYDGEPFTKFYVLKSKDKPLIYFDYHVPSKDNPNVTVKEIVQENTKLLPLGIDATGNGLKEWLLERRAPLERENVIRLLDFYGTTVEDPLRYLEVSRGLSLIDTYWVSSDDAKWNDVKLYDKELDKAAAKIAFEGNTQGLVTGIDIASPELVTDGCLRKYWANTGTGIVLRKAEEPARIKTDGRSTVVMEYYAAQVAAAMGIPHIPYSIGFYSGDNYGREMICECPLFTSEDVGYVNGFKLLRYFFPDMTLEELSKKITVPDFHLEFAAKYGFDAYADMMVFDAVILNTDRHFGNFGYLINNNTGRLIGPAPLFDNGNSLLMTAFPVMSAGTMESYLTNDIICPRGKYMPFKEQAMAFIQKRHIPILEKLEKFTFKEPEDYWLSLEPEYLEAMDRAVRVQARRLLEWYR